MLQAKFLHLLSLWNWPPILSCKAVFNGEMLHKHMLRNIPGYNIINLLMQCAFSPRWRLRLFFQDCSKPSGSPFLPTINSLWLGGLPYNQRMQFLAPWRPSSRSGELTGLCADELANACTLLIITALIFLVNETHGDPCSHQHIWTFTSCLFSGYWASTNSAGPTLVVVELISFFLWCM